MTRYLIAALALAEVAALALMVTGCANSTSRRAAGHTSAVSAPNPTAASPASASAASTPSPTPAHHHPHRACDAALWQHVYHPDRLHVIHSCMTVRGRVDAVRQEPDGDLHILLATRPALVNSANVTYEHGDLVLEEICEGPVTQADAIDACQGVPHNLTVPSAGDRVRGHRVLRAGRGPRLDGDTPGDEADCHRPRCARTGPRVRAVVRAAASIGRLPSDHL